MPIDLQRIAQAVAAAAVDDSGAARVREDKEPRRRSRPGLSGPRAFLIGAGLVTAGRLLVASRRRNLLEGVQQRLAEYEARHFGPDQAADAAEEELELVDDR